MTLGEKILHLRKSNGMSQEQLAEKVTISRQTISKWELGESMPDIGNILQLSKVFGVSTDYLLNDDFNAKMNIPETETISENSSKAPHPLLIRVSVAVVVMFAVLSFKYLIAGRVLLGVGYGAIAVSNIIRLIKRLKK